MTLAVAETRPTAIAASPRELRHGAIALRSADEVEHVAAAGAVVSAALDAAASAVRAGVSTAEIDAVVRATIAAHGAEPSFLGYAGANGAPAFPAACCISVNEEAVHGIPGARTLAAGDLVSIDVGARLHGWCADAAVTVVVPGAPNRAELESFVADAWESLHAGIAAMQPGARWSDVAARMQRVAFERGHGVVDGWHGHGVGVAVHEAPQAPSVVTPGLREQRDFTLLPGMVIAVEPILVIGARGQADAQGCASCVPAALRADGWTVAVSGGLVAAHVEHTVAVTRTGPRILTRRNAARGCACGPASTTNDTDGGRCRHAG
jgi:methionyl aminopeptidase